ncbi:glutaredoxin domain-containing protein [Bacillus sp. FJAT-29814]|uniref:glutaredoxin family protein n=1 Tax=Bacillus sp. FJAT-29814 TaxID=1729688 RepID=UPI0009E9DAEE
MDCKAAKEFLSGIGYRYTEVNVQEQPEKEQELIKLSGTRIVPTFLFQKKGFLGSKKKVIIGFEQNREQVEELVGLNK